MPTFDDLAWLDQVLPPEMTWLFKRALERRDERAGEPEPADLFDALKRTTAPA